MKAASICSPAELRAPQRGRHTLRLSSTSTAEDARPTLASPDVLLVNHQ